MGFFNFEHKHKHSTDESLTDVSELISGIDAGDVIVRGHKRHRLTDSEIALLQKEGHEDALIEAREKGMIREDDERTDTIH